MDLPAPLEYVLQPGDKVTVRERDYLEQLSIYERAGVIYDMLKFADQTVTIKSECGEHRATSNDNRYKKYYIVESNWYFSELTFCNPNGEPFIPSSADDIKSLFGITRRKKDA